MTPEEISRFAELLHLTPWYIAAEATFKFSDPYLGTGAGLAWDYLQQKIDTDQCLVLARTVMKGIGWSVEVESNRTEIARLILEKVFGE